MIEDIIKFTEDNIDAEDKHDHGLLLWDHDSNFWSCLSSASVLSSINLIISLTWSGITIMNIKTIL